jgi:type I restriction enzyme S subunit
LAYWEIGREIVDFEQKGKRLDSAYVDALVRIPLFAQEATRYSKGVWSSRLRLYPEGLFEIWMPVPPLKEQRAIVSYISTETAKLEALWVAAERTIRLLKERRAALIAAAVTGKIKSLSSFAVSTENWV